MNFSLFLSIVLCIIKKVEIVVKNLFRMLLNNIASLFLKISVKIQKKDVFTNLPIDFVFLLFILIFLKTPLLLLSLNIVIFYFNIKGETTNVPQLSILYMLGRNGRNNNKYLEKSSISKSPSEKEKNLNNEVKLTSGQPSYKTNFTREKSFVAASQKEYLRAKELSIIPPEFHGIDPDFGLKVLNESFSLTAKKHILVIDENFDIARKTPYVKVLGNLTSSPNPVIIDGQPCYPVQIYHKTYRGYDKPQYYLKYPKEYLMFREALYEHCDISEFLNTTAKASMDIYEPD